MFEQIEEDDGVECAAIKRNILHIEFAVLGSATDAGSLLDRSGTEITGYDFPIGPVPRDRPSITPGSCPGRK